MLYPFSKSNLRRAILAVAAFIVGYQCLTRPVTGIADNGDFFRLTALFGLQHSAVTADDQYFKYVDPIYVFNPQVHLPAQFRYISSETLMTGLAVGLSRLTSKTGTFDIRVQGFVHSIFFLAAVWLLLRLRGLEIRGKTLAAAGLGLVMLTDVGYVAYFNSFYCETASFLFGLFFIAFVARGRGDAVARIDNRRSLDERRVVSNCEATERAARRRNCSPMLLPCMAAAGLRTGASVVGRRQFAAHCHHPRPFLFDAGPCAADESV